METKSKDLGSIFASQLPMMQNEPMDSDSSEMFIRMCMLENSGNQEDIDGFYKHLSEHIWSLEALYKRQELLLSLPISKPVLCMISYLTEGNIGQGLLYLYYIQWKGKLGNFTQITTEELSHIFPMGFFTDSSLHELWDSQKDGGTNLIDNGEACKSIM